MYSRIATCCVLALALTAPSPVGGGESSEGVQSPKTPPGNTVKWWLQEAKKAINGIEDPLKKIDMICDAAKVEARSGDKDAAINSCKIALDIAGTLTIYPNEARDWTVEQKRQYAYDIIIKSQVEAGLYEEALKTAKKTTGSKTKAYYEIAKTEADEGHIKQAREIAAKIKKKGYRASAFLAIARAEAKEAKYAQAVNTVMKEVPDRLRKESIYHIVVAAMKAGHFNAAIDITVMLAPYGKKILNPSVLVEIAAEQAGTGKKKDAAKTLAQAKKKLAGIKDFTADRDTLLLVAGAEFLLGNKDAAAEIFKRLKVRVTDSPVNRYTISGLCDIAGAEAEADMPDAAKGTLDIAKKLAGNLPDEDKFHPKRSSALGSIAICQARCGFFEQAIITARSIPKIKKYRMESISYRSLRHIASEAGKTGRFDLAHKILLPGSKFDRIFVAMMAADAGAFEQAKKISKSANALCYIACAEMKAGRKDDAIETFKQAITASSSMQRNFGPGTTYYDAGVVMTETGLNSEATTIYKSMRATSFFRARFCTGAANGIIERKRSEQKS